MNLPESVLTGKEPVMVSVLFTDVVGGSRAANDDQQRVNERLTKLVMTLPEFQEAQKAGELISLPTGDGFALVFFGRRVDAPLRCAIEISRALKADPFCKLRIGIHSGLVLVSDDLTGKPNVNGEGINLAERVMSCGGDGHILLSDVIAGRLKGMAAWRDKLHYLGEFVAKKDTPTVWSFIDGDIGSKAPLKAVSKKAQMRQRVGFVAGVLIAALLGGWFFTREPAANPVQSSFSYSLMLVDSKGQTRAVQPGQTVPAGSMLRFQFDSPQQGFLYMLAEGSQTANWLFPGPGYLGGGGTVNIELDTNPGRETIRMLWSQRRIDEAEAIKDQVMINQSGELMVGQAATMARLMEAAAPASLQPSADGATLATGEGTAIAANLVVTYQ